MQLLGLTVVRLDGSLPDTRQLLWRNFGYLLSAATLMLGFLWAIWDEDRFTWHDRMSQSYITAAAPLTALEPVEVHADEPPLHPQITPVNSLAGVQEVWPAVAIGFEQPQPSD